MVHIGLSQAATVRVGRALGARDGIGLARAGAMALVVSGGFVAVTITMFLVIPEPLLGIFVEPDDPDRATVIAIGVTLLAMAALFQCADAAQVMALGLLRGVQDTSVPMVLAAISYWGIGAPASLLLGFALGWGGVGVWAGLVIGLGCAGLALMHRFWGLRRWERMLA